jgi:hypothetical protein
MNRLPNFFEKTLFYLNFPQYYSFAVHFKLYLSLMSTRYVCFIGSHILCVFQHCFLWHIKRFKKLKSFVVVFFVQLLRTTRRAPLKVCNTKTLANRMPIARKFMTWPVPNCCGTHKHTQTIWDQFQQGRWAVASTL